MKIFEVSLDGCSQWIAAENLKAAFDYVDGNTPFAEQGTCDDQLIIELIPEEKWDEKWIGDEDNASAEHRSLREALTDALYFPCLLACEL